MTAKHPVGVAMALAIATLSVHETCASATVIGIDLRSESWGYNCTSVTLTPDPHHADTGTVTGNCHEKNGDDNAMAHIFHSGFDAGPRGGWTIHVRGSAPLPADEIWMYCHFAYDNGAVVMFGCPSDSWGA